MSRGSATWLVVAVVGQLAAAGCSNAPPATRATHALRHTEDGDNAWRAGRYSAASRRYERALMDARARDDRPLVATLLLRQAKALAAAGGCRFALPRLGEAAALRKTLRQPVAPVRLVQGRCRAALGDTAGARTSLNEAAHSPDGCTRKAALASLGALAVRRGDLAGAASRYDEADGVGCSQASPRAQLRYNQGRLAQRKGDHEAARARLADAARLYGRAQEEAGLADALSALATSQLALGQRAEAASSFRRAGHAAWTVGLSRRAAWAFGMAAKQLRALGRQAEAARCVALGQAALARDKALR